jgi:signal transduction histidine kinase
MTKKRKRKTLITLPIMNVHANVKEPTHKKKITMSLRVKLAMASIITVCSACVVSGLIVVVGMYFGFSGHVTIQVAAIMCLVVCILTMLIGGVTLWHEALYVTNPITRISDGVKRVADGDFTVQLTLKHRNVNDNDNYFDEIDELSSNFNKMVNELNSMDYMRKDFMSNVSHEIKTPVAAITGFTEILLDGGLSTEEQREYLVYLNQESIRLSRLCENMLRMSRLDNQVIVDKNKEVKIDEQLRRCIIMLSEKWSDKEINFDLQLDKCKILNNYDLLFQVWTNLIDNAIKYSATGSTIWVSAKVVDNYLIVKIRDEGIGMNPENLDKIYDKFYQCDESHKKQGSGLGLSIVKKIIELLEGNITCESELGKGTIMTVNLPVS